MPDSSRTFATPDIFSDLPLEPKDEQAFFRFEEYATTFARMVASPTTRTPLVLGINGKWGSGKTTLLRLIQSKLDTTQFLDDNLSKVVIAGDGDKRQDFRRCCTVWFDAWKYANEDSLLAALTRVIMEAMSQGGLKAKLQRLLAEKDQERYDVLATFISAFSFKFDGADFGVDINKYKTESPLKTHTAFFDHFTKAFDQLLALWVHDTLNPRKIDPAHGALTVFIDDLDRCLPAKAVQVLEAVKLFLDKPGVAFVIGADEERIRAAVKACYAEQGMTDRDASDYLEKVFQIRFPLPPLRSKQMGDYMRAERGLRLPPALQNSVELILAGAETNPRRIKTTLNYLEVNWAVLKNSGEAADDLRDDFIRWLLIEYAASDFADHARRIDDHDLRFKFIADAVAWAKGGDAPDFVEKHPVLANTFRDYAGNIRLRRVLGLGMFSAKVNAARLDDFVYWSARAPDEAEIDSTPPTEQEESLTRRVEAVAVKIEKVMLGGIAWVTIPAGKFIMGSDADSDEKPQHTVEIPYPYRLACFPVTNAQYREFVEANGSDWKPIAGNDHPAVNVSWRNAVTYCDWLTKKLRAIGELQPNQIIRLPTEAEWEKAARGEYGNEWPWGNDFDPAKCNTNEGGQGGTTPVGAYSPVGDSPYGAADMAGNVWEWCSSLYKPYPYKADDGREDLKATGERVLRGGSWYFIRRHARCASRLRSVPGNFHSSIGFRLCSPGSYS